MSQVTAQFEMISNEAIDARVQKSKCLRIAFCCVPEMGHFIPLMRLAAAVREKGHTVAMFGMKYHHDKCRKFMDASDLEEVVLTCPDEPAYTRHQVTVGVEKDRDPA